VRAVTAYQEAAERKLFDDAIAGMANDEKYRRKALQTVEEFGGQSVSPSPTRKILPCSVLGTRVLMARR
jgi:hypothetical protein